MKIRKGQKAFSADRQLQCGGEKGKDKRHVKIVRKPGAFVNEFQEPKKV